MLVRLILLLVAIALAVYKPAAPPTLQTPLTLTLAQTVGMTPLHLRVKVRAADRGREVCIVVEGPESMQSCRTIDGVTWTLEFTLRTGGCYSVYAVNPSYQTAPLKLNVVGLNGEECGN